MLTRLRHQLLLLGIDEKGQTMVEYGLLVALIAVVCIAAVTQVGTAASGVFAYVQGKLVTP